MRPNAANSEKMMKLQWIVLATAMLAGCVGVGKHVSTELVIDGFYTCTTGKDQVAAGKDETVFRCSIRNGEFVFRFDVVDSDVCVAEVVKHPLDIANGDRVELYFVPDRGMTDGYRCAEIDASGRILSYSVDEKKNYDWFWKFKTLQSQARHTANGYSVEGSFAVDELVSFGIDPNDFFLGVFRAEMSAPGKVSRWCSAVPIVLPAKFHQPAMIFPFR